jgi:hypothetical protein
MTYQVSRNGQLYGPYTLEDLQRYVASGNVLPSDMAKSEEMADWQTVAQILGSTTGLSGIPVPAYGAPQTPYAPLAAVAYPDPPNLNWGLEVLLGFLTCGVFVVVWNLIIAAWANRVQPTSKALMLYIAATVFIALNVGGSWGVMISLAHHTQPTHQNVLGNIISLACWIVRLIARFTLRDTIEEHFNRAEPLGLRLNPVMTFFFGGIYFQYKLNEVNQMKQALRYRNAMR